MKKLTLFCFLLAVLSSALAKDNSYYLPVKPKIVQYKVLNIKDIPPDRKIVEIIGIYEPITAKAVVIGDQTFFEKAFIRGQVKLGSWVVPKKTSDSLIVRTYLHPGTLQIIIKTQFAEYYHPASGFWLMEKIQWSDDVQYGKQKNGVFYQNNISLSYSRYRPDWWLCSLVILYLLLVAILYLSVIYPTRQWLKKRFPQTYEDENVWTVLWWILLIVAIIVIICLQWVLGLILLVGFIVSLAACYLIRNASDLKESKIKKAKRAAFA